MPTMKIYTRHGDHGQTTLLGGQRVSKTNARVKTYGAVDELQSHLGVARAALDLKTFADIVLGLQQHLLMACAQLAAPGSSAQYLKVQIGSAEIHWLEKTIDSLTASHGLPSGFVLPGHDAASAAMHVARTVCRRCERLIVMLCEQSEEDLAQLCIYFNRLSDLLFSLAWALELRAMVKDILMTLIRENAEGA